MNPSTLLLNQEPRNNFYFSPTSHILHFSHLIGFNKIDLQKIKNSKISVEEFHQNLQQLTNFPLRPFVIPFLKASLPLLQCELMYLTQAFNLEYKSEEEPVEQQQQQQQPKMSEINYDDYSSYGKSSASSVADYESFMQQFFMTNNLNIQ
jgi:hypothetical protein